MNTVIKIRMYTLKLMSALGLLLLVQACEFDNIYNDHVDIDNYIWKSSETLTFDINLAPEDITVPGDIFYEVRYGMQYPYQNLYIAYVLKDSSGGIVKEGMQNLLLFDEITGKPKGESVSDIYNYQFTAFENFYFSGQRYTLDINQFMRDEDLPQIMSFGVKIKRTPEQRS